MGIKADINNAFLNEDLADKVYIYQLQGFKDTSSLDSVCKLNKALYILNQAQRAWFLKLSMAFVELRFLSLKVDTSMFVQFVAVWVIVLLMYIHNIISNTCYLQDLVIFLHAKFIPKDLSDLNFFLGIKTI